MLRKIAISLFGLAGAAVIAAAPVAAQSYTTRIETRPFYGAVVTLEEGVRVFRPLPPERQVIINPGGQTPLSLGFNETNVYEHRNVYNHNSHDGASYSSARTGRGFYGFAPGYGRGHYRSNGNGQSGVSGTPAVRGGGQH
jgi:hypothetical protein